MLADYTVECRGGGWYYTRSSHFSDKQKTRGPYSSMASVTLMIARELKREINKRDLSGHKDSGHGHQGAL
jgi:hypothetical protein